MIDETRGTIGQRGKKVKKPSQAELLTQVAQHLAGRLCFDPSLRFPVRYMAIPVDMGRHLIVQEIDDTGLVKISNRDAVANDVLRWGQFKTQFGIKDKQTAMKVVDWWLAISEQYPMPPAFRMADEHGVTFSRLPWVLKPGPTPTWDGMLARLSNAKALKAWIGRLFVPNSPMQQYVWVHGPGDDGKGCLNRFLERVFGPAYGAMQPRERGDKFWTYALLGKQLVVFPDCNDQAFVSGSLFKSMTGGDSLPFEAKGQMAFTSRINARYMIFSNEKPLISSEKADMRRIIYCSFEERTHEDTVDFEDRLWNEGGQFLHSCLSQAQEAPNCRLGSGDKIGDWIEVVESIHQETLDFHFSIDKKVDALGVSGSVLQTHLKSAYRSRKDQLEFIAWLERVHGIRRVTVSTGTFTGLKHYKGLHVKKTPGVY